MTYYGVVRQTIHGTDHLRVKTATAGITLSLTVLSLSVVCWKSLGSLPVAGVDVPLNNFAAFALACASTWIAYVYWLYMKMFNSFFACEVGIAIAIEERLLCTNVRNRMEYRGQQSLVDVTKDVHPREYLAVSKCRGCDRDLALTQGMQKTDRLAGAYGAAAFSNGLRTMIGISVFVAILYLIEIQIGVTLN